ncbi:MAG: hypothetical protein ACI31M_03230 [Bacilli bacterium]
MKKIYQYSFLVIIMIFSFYFTNKASLIAKNSNPIMKSINEVKDDMQVNSIDAIINDEYIIPGLNGLEVNVNESFNQMRPYKIFNKYYLSYNQVPPEISLEDNKEKIIISGNKSKKQATIIIEYNSTFIKYLDNLKINYDILTNLETYGTSNERLNNENKDFKALEKQLDKDKINTNICIINSDVNINECKKRRYYLVEALELKKDGLLEIKNKIENGVIIKVNKDVTKEELELLIKYIHNKDLDIVFLSKLITEVNVK